jgi:hypothetical protein
MERGCLSRTLAYHEARALLVYPVTRRNAVIRLPRTKSPRSAESFRKLREILPHLFSPNEHIRYIKDFGNLRIQGIADALLQRTGNPATCNSPGCDTVHAPDGFYEELAEVCIGLVFLKARRPHELREMFVELFKDLEHVCENRSDIRSNGLPLPDRQDIIGALVDSERRKRERVERNQDALG